MKRAAALDGLLRRGLVWRGGEAEEGREERIGTGFSALDEAIGGWPRQGLVELISSAGQGLSLLLPLLRRLSGEERWLAWVNPPGRLHVPALAVRGVPAERLLMVRGGAEGAWATEQLLRSGGCSLVLFWPGRIASVRLRRLQLAAETGRSLGVLFRPVAAQEQASPAVLRLRLEGGGDRLRVMVLKRRGGWSGARVTVACAG